MAPSRNRWRLAARAVPLIALLLLGGCASGGSGGATPAASFALAGSCTADGRRAGAYPELEARLPREYEGTGPTSVDSGRTCTRAALGTLAAAGIDDLRYAGATWDLGSGRGLTVATFEATGLDPARMIDFYADGARTARRVEKGSSTDTTVAGRPARRLDVLQSDGTGQTIVAWPTDTPGRINVLLASDLGDTKVAQALETFGRPQG